MTEMAKGSVTHQRLIALLSQEGANFRVVTHEAVGKCEAVSEIRGTALGQGAKALVCKVKGEIKTLEEARKAADEKGIHYEQRHKKGDILNLFFEEFVEEHLIQPTFVMDHQSIIT